MKENLWIYILKLCFLFSFVNCEGIKGRIGSWAELANEINLLVSSDPEPHPTYTPRAYSDDPLYHKEFCGEINVVSSFQRIVGGTEVQKGSAPWQVGIATLPEKSDGKIPTITCGGTLLTEYAVVTAAHCFTLSPSRYEVHIGRHHSNLKLEECNEQKFKVIRYVLHPDFEKKTLKNDIALVSIRSFFGQGVHFTNWIIPACIGYGFDKDFYPPGYKGTVTGWGLLDETKELVVTPMMKVDLPIVDDNTCRNAYKKIVNIESTKQFCAGESGGGKDACSGDSGGPFTRTISSSIGSREFLIGVVSYGLGCARVQYPGVYTKVTAYLPWIKEHIQSIHDEADPRPATNYPVTPSTTTTTRRTTTTTTTTTKSTTTKSTTTTTTQPPYSKVPDDVQTVGPVCADSFRYLRCSTTQNMRIVSVFYGRKDESTCSEAGKEFRARAASLRPATRDCEYSGARDDLARFCKGKRFCYVNNLTYNRGGPFNYNKCENENPYVYVQYACEDKKIEIYTKEISIKTEDICRRGSISCESETHLQILSAVIQRKSEDKTCERRNNRYKKNSKRFSACTEDVLESVQKDCLDKKTCSLNVRKHARRSKCRSVYPYLSVKYTCFSGSASLPDDELEIDDNFQDGGPPTTGGGDLLDTTSSNSDISDDSTIWSIL